MDDDHLDEPPEAFDFRSPPYPADDLDAGLDAEVDDPWVAKGARRGPRPAAEGVRIIGADEAAAAIESGHVAPKKPEDELRFGDVPPQPAGPRPSLRFPGADPASVAKPPVAGEPIPPQDKQSAAAEAARRWDEALARSTASRPRPRATSLFADPADEDPFGAGRPQPQASAAGPPTGPPTGPPDYDPFDPYEPAAAPPSGPPTSFPTGPPDYDPLPSSPAFGANWLDEEPDLLAPAPGPAPSRPAPPTGPPAYDPAAYEAPSMQHWTEPPSGEVPKILIDDDEAQAGEDDLSAWGALGARPRWRDQPNDWEDADFNEAILADEGHRVGALRGRDDSSPFSFDDPEPEAAVAPPPPPGFDRPGGGAPTSLSGGRARISTLPTGGPPLPPGGPHVRDSKEVSTRVVVGAIAVGVLLVAAAIGPAMMAFLVAVALTLATAEFYNACRKSGYHPATLLGLVGAPAMAGAVYWRGLDAYPLVLSLFVVFTMLWYLTGVVRARPTMNIAVTLLGFLYVSFLGSFAILILAWVKGLILTPARDDVVGILLGAILATAAFDIGCYFVGRSMGKTPLAPAISPNKTIEGLVGGALAAVFVCVALVRAIGPWDGGKAFWLAIVVSVAAPLGDLCESMIKRDLGVKDMGALLPGHGGVLDRIDALLFVVPAVYALARVVFP